MFYKILILNLCILYSTVNADTPPAAKYKTCSDAPKDVCGLNAKCFDALSSSKFQTYGEPFCACLPNFSGQPPNCKSLCPIDCKTDEYCDVANKVCKKGCASLDGCKPGEYCEPKTKTCKAGCLVSTNCNANEYCDYGKNVCKKGCRTSQSCKDDEYCDAGSRQCKKGCRLQTNSCKPKEYCDSTRVCKPGCSAHADCASDEVCRTDHKCIKGCIRSPCGSNSDCSVVNNKYYCTCKTGFFPENGKGCRAKQTADVIPKDEKDLDCKKYCSELGLCKLNNNNVSCFCPRVSWGNPYNDCKPKTPPAPPKSPNDVPLSALSIAATSG
ncbi:hypothetical protein ACKWTF_011662 [Chironomus riparius]